MRRRYFFLKKLTYFLKYMILVVVKVQTKLHAFFLILAKLDELKHRPFTPFGQLLLLVHLN